ncbi:hypothetical protein GCM10023188_15700 [Pontibacter saemangeumensis]|uniref:Uncharacterized protein n=1 Tax=Pontibacter saemangeumensis TaxID=1084525 RepID=A0ABP8LKD4_9BACT
MKCGYTLEWLDALINVSLNPAKTKLDADAVAPGQIQYIKSKIEEEKIRHQSFLNNQVFDLLEENKIEVLIRQYYATLILLLDQAWHNEMNTLSRNPLFKEIHLSLIQSLEELILFIEVRFPAYLTTDQRASVTHLLAVKKELKILMTSTKPQLEKKINDKPLTDIVFTTLHTFLTKIKDSVPVALHDVLYIKNLVKKLKELSKQDEHTCNSASLYELLIYLNFNSPAYINYFTHTTTEKIVSYKTIPEQLETLLLLRKDFKQMNSKPGVALNIHKKNLRTIIGNWFDQEVQYLEKKQHLSVIPPQGSTEASKNKQEEPLKVLCVLSVDQMGLVLRAADESKIIMARSLNAVFKQIVPYLSTASKENISWDSMRSKSYAAEKRDKEIVIQKLEQMIKKVREY